MTTRIFRFTLFFALLLGFTALAGAQQKDPTTERLEKRAESLQHDVDYLHKKIDDNLWFERVGDVAVVEKVRIYGPEILDFWTKVNCLSRVA